MSRITRNSFLACVVVGLLVGFAGCFASKFTLIAPEQAKVDRAYLGDWDVTNADGEISPLIILNLDDKHYYVETPGKEPKETQRYVGFIADVKGATFAHLRFLTNSDVADEWILMRIELVGDKLTIRQLDENFFKAQIVESAEQLRQIIEKNLNEDAMYAKDEVLTATRSKARPSGNFEIGK